MPLYIVNRTEGWRLQPHAPAVPCGEVVELSEEIGEPAVDQGYLVPDYPTPYLTDEHKEKLARYREEKKPESPERKKKPERKPGPSPIVVPPDVAETGGIVLEIEEPEPAVSDNSASLPVMITQKQRRDLRAKGLTDSDIDKMTPQEAHDALK